MIKIRTLFLLFIPFKNIHCNIFIYAYILFFSTIFEGCNNPTNIGNTSKSKPYFDLKGFFEKEIQALKNKPILLNKTVWLNGKKESKVSANNIDWENELSTFLASDINKAAFIGYYQSDTTLLHSDTIRISHTALKPDFRTQRTSIYCSPNHKNIYQINIENQVSNLLYTSIEKLSYTPQKEYTIAVQQKIIWHMGDTLSIKGSFSDNKK